MHKSHRTDLHFLGTLRSAADIAVRNRNEVWEAVAAGLVHKVPCKDGGVILVQPVIDGITPVHHGNHVILEELLGAWVCEENVMALGSRPLDVLQKEACVRSRDHSMDGTMLPPLLCP